MICRVLRQGTVAGCLGGIAVVAAAQLANCPPRHTSQGANPAVTCSGTLSNGLSQSRACVGAAVCPNGSTLSCCNVLDGNGAVIAIACICVANNPGGGCDPRSLQPGCDETYE